MGVLDSLVFGLRDVFDTSNTQQPRRSRIRFPNATITDDPINGWLNVAFSGGAGGAAAPVTNSGTGTLNDVVSQNTGVDTDVVRFTGAAPTATGFTAGAGGTRFLAVRSLTGPLVLANENSGSAAANRITTGTGGNVTVATGGAALLKYDSVSTRWLLVGTIGSAITPAGNAGDLQTKATGTSFGSLAAGADGTGVRCSGGSFVVSSIQDPPAGSNNDVVGLDGSGHFKNLGPMTAGSAAGSAHKIQGASGTGGGFEAQGSTLDNTNGMSLTVGLGGSIAGTSVFSFKETVIATAGGVNVQTPAQYSCPVQRYTGATTCTQEIPAQNGAVFLIINTGLAQVTFRAPGKSGTSITSTFLSGWIYFNDATGDYRILGS